LIATPRSSLYFVPSSTSTAMRGSRRRFTIFCDFVNVSNAIFPSTSANQSVVRCGAPSAPIVATWRLLRSSMNFQSSSSLIRI